MIFSQRFFKTASLAAFPGGVIIFVFQALQFSYPAPASLEETIALLGNPAYNAAQWLHFALIFCMLVTILAVAAKKIDSATGLVTTGFIFFLIDFFSTLLYNSTQLFTIHLNWLPRLAAARSEAEKADILAKISFYNDLTPALFVLIFIGATVGMALYGIATWKGRGLEKVVSVLFLIAFAGNLVLGVGYYGAQPLLVAAIGPVVSVVLGALLALIGAWLWPTGTRTRGQT